MWRSLASNALTFLVVAAFLIGGLILWGKTQYSAEGPLEEQICLRVERGANMSGVSRDLAEQGAISNDVVFRLGADYTDKAGDLKAGSFLIPAGASMAEITDIVTRGGASTCGTVVVYRVGVTQSNIEVQEIDPATQKYIAEVKFDVRSEEIPPEYEAVRKEPDTRYRIDMAEGVTSWQVVDTLKRVDVLEGEIAEVPAEGTLAPSSYEIVIGDDRSAILERMQAAQSDVLSIAWENRVEGLPVKSKEEALILASIIEKETGVAEERRQVASVFINRLNRGMKLQTDPTVIYGLTQGEGVLGRGLRQSELRKETPWNTYVIPALPPTPIANPGKASIEAALDPAETDFVYFVADGSGGHAFSTTLEEHNANVAKWRRIEAEQSQN